jgi:hypothetical protein
MQDVTSWHVSASAEQRETSSMVSSFEEAVTTSDTSLGISHSSCDKCEPHVCSPAILGCEPTGIF